MQATRKLQWFFMGLLIGCILLLNGGNASASASLRAQVPQSESSVSYPGVNGATLAGTLLIPAHRQGEHLSGVVIVAGSGPVDRNGNVPQGGIISNLYQQLAEDLAQHGIASLRYDKRGVGASTPIPLPKDLQHPTPAEIAAIQNFVAWKNYVGDAAASLRYVQSLPAIDSWRTAMLGHSEGTYISEVVATTSYPGLRKPAALVLAGAPGRTIDRVLREQLINIFTKLQIGAPVETFLLQQYDAIITGIKQTGQIPQQPLVNVQNDAQVPAEIKTLFQELFPTIYDQFWAGELRVVPTRLVREYRGPVLILQGASDQNVFANEDTPLLDEALAQRSHDDHLTLLVPNTGHFLKYVQNATDPGITGPVVPQVLFMLPFWLNVKLAQHFGQETIKTA